jgi:hypothetical protein
MFTPFLVDRTCGVKIDVVHTSRVVNSWMWCEYFVQCASDCDELN